MKRLCSLKSSHDYLNNLDLFNRYACTLDSMPCPSLHFLSMQCIFPNLDIFAILFRLAITGNSADAFGFSCLLQRFGARHHRQFGRRFHSFAHFATLLGLPSPTIQRTLSLIWTFRNAFGLAITDNSADAFAHLDFLQRFCARHH